MMLLSGDSVVIR